MIPFRVCCGKQHIGPVCPDNMVMCCFCFDRFETDELAIDVDNETIDVCQPCWNWDQEQVRKRDEGLL